MKKRIFSLFLALCMTLALLPTAAFAEDGGVTISATVNGAEATVEDDGSISATYGQSVVLTAKIDGTDATGTIVWAEGTITNSTFTATNSNVGTGASLTLNNPSVGIHAYQVSVTPATQSVPEEGIDSTESDAPQA